VRSHPGAVHNLLAYYHQLGRWNDGLQLIGQHRRHLAAGAPARPLLKSTLEFLQDAAAAGRANPAWVRRMTDYIAGLDLEAGARASLEQIRSKAEGNSAARSGAPAAPARD
jgi:hypothetical protein